MSHAKQLKLSNPGLHEQTNEKNPKTSDEAMAFLLDSDPASNLHSLNPQSPSDSDSEAGAKLGAKPCPKRVRPSLKDLFPRTSSLVSSSISFTPAALATYGSQEHDVSATPIHLENTPHSPPQIRIAAPPSSPAQSGYQSVGGVTSGSASSPFFRTRSTSLPSNTTPPDSPSCHSVKCAAPISDCNCAFDHNAQNVLTITVNASLQNLVNSLFFDVDKSSLALWMDAHSKWGSQGTWSPMNELPFMRQLSYKYPFKSVLETARQCKITPSNIFKNRIRKKHGSSVSHEVVKLLVDRLDSSQLLHLPVPRSTPIRETRICASDTDTVTAVNSPTTSLFSATTASSSHPWNTKRNPSQASPDVTRFYEASDQSTSSGVSCILAPDGAIKKRRSTTRKPLPTIPLYTNTSTSRTLQLGNSDTSAEFNKGPIAPPRTKFRRSPYSSTVCSDAKSVSRRISSAASDLAHSDSESSVQSYHSGRSSLYSVSSPFVDTPPAMYVRQDPFAAQLRSDAIRPILVSLVPGANASPVCLKYESMSKQAPNDNAATNSESVQGICQSTRSLKSSAVSPLLNDPPAMYVKKEPFLAQIRADAVKRVPSIWEVELKPVELISVAPSREKQAPQRVSDWIGGVQTASSVSADVIVQSSTTAMNCPVTSLLPTPFQKSATTHVISSSADSIPIVPSLSNAPLRSTAEQPLSQTRPHTLAAAPLQVTSDLTRDKSSTLKPRSVRPPRQLPRKVTYRLKMPGHWVRGTRVSDDAFLDALPARRAWVSASAGLWVWMQVLMVVVAVCGIVNFVTFCGKAWVAAGIVGGWGLRMVAKVSKEVGERLISRVVFVRQAAQGSIGSAMPTTACAKVVDVSSVAAVVAAPTAVFVDRVARAGEDEVGLFEIFLEVMKVFF
ncbi:hypothetical protein BC830DRAFT_1081751 [Chytriomyces sp. MP71]|nr:hypothetical protein BC830DRAFT_1081751 [Chytriomyces sp. MP71]